MPRRVLVVRLGAMGDVIHALPAVAALRHAQPDCEIGWVIERRWSPLLVRDDAPLAGARGPERPLVDRVHIVSTRSWRNAPFSDETWAEVRNVVGDLRAQRYDMAIDFQGAWKSAILAQLSRAESRIGFAQPREKPAAMFYTRLVPARGTHVIEQNLSLLDLVIAPRPSVIPPRPLVIPPPPPVIPPPPLVIPPPPLVIPSEARNPGFSSANTIGNTIDNPPCSSVPSVVNAFPHDPAAEHSIEPKITVHPFAILNPGAGWAAKQWPAERYGDVAQALRESGIASLVNYGPGEESLAAAVASASDGAAHPISCTVPELIALTRRASLFIGGDTGPMHLANALGIPVVALFGPTDPVRNGPYDFSGRRHATVLRSPLSRTTYSHTNTADPGLLAITAAEVISAARALLALSSRKPTPESRQP